MRAVPRVIIDAMEQIIADLEQRLISALSFREQMLLSEHSTAFRLFNGFSEGLPGLIADIYGRTLVCFISARLNQEQPDLLSEIFKIYSDRLPWVRCSIIKLRPEKDPSLRAGRIASGADPDQQIEEHGVRYALDLCLNQDASFYLETRSLRLWLKEHANGWRVLNLFAYTGSLGIAALAGGAEHVLQVDRSRKFLALARQSAILNRLDLGRMKLRSIDFFQAAAELKSRSELFDCIVLDPPYFSNTDFGRVNLIGDFSKLINKVRPLIKDNGRLVAINNALFYSGGDYVAELEQLCQDGFLSIEAFFEVPADVAGDIQKKAPTYPTDPAPFNHPTKIAVLKVFKRNLQ